MGTTTPSKDFWQPPTFERGGELSRDEVFDILQNRRRRYVLHYLKQQQAPVSARDLTEQVAAWEYDTAVTELESQERHRVYVSLTQTHLPKMVETDVVSIDEDAGTVRLTEQAADLDVYLEVVPQNDIDWPQFYAGVALLNTGLLTVATLNVPVISQAPDDLWMLAITLVFFLAALVHNWFYRENRLGTDGPPPS